MGGGLKPYPAYKDSGVDWIAQVPLHWDVRRSRFLFREVDERSQDGSETHLSMSQQLGLVPSSKVETRTLVAESHCGGKLCEKDDLVLNRLKAHLGVFAKAKQYGVVSPDYTVLRPLPSVNVGFFEATLRSPACRSELRVRAKGIVEGFWRLYTDDFYSITLPAPPAEEQAGIVRYIDHMDRRTRRYIHAKQKLIKLLQEQKQGLIHQAVTGQIDVRTGEPYPVVGDSGVEWLGRVPAHWSVAALRHRYTQCLGKMLDAGRITGKHLLPYLRNTDVQWDTINTDDLPQMDIAPEEYERYTLRVGDLLVCEGGEVGRAAIWAREMGAVGFQKALHRLRPRDAGRDLPGFLLLALKAAARAGAFEDGRVSTIAHLTGDRLRAHPFPFPPIDEQAEIVGHLQTVVEQLNGTVSLAQREISLLREYRVRLVADVVTGKLDVREAAASLPDEKEMDVDADGAFLEEAQAERGDGDPVSVAQEALA